jgi:hypothetical protein
MVEPSYPPTTGWCIHGVAFGTNCPACSGSAYDGMSLTYTAPAWTPEKVDELLFTLHRIAKDLETLRLRK